MIDWELAHWRRLRARYYGVNPAAPLEAMPASITAFVALFLEHDAVLTPQRPFSPTAAEPLSTPAELDRQPGQS